MSAERSPLEELRRALLTESADRNRRMSAGLPHLKTALLEMREAAALGANGPSFRAAQDALAAFIEQCETDLVRT